MLVVVIQNEFINETTNLVIEKKYQKTDQNLAPEKFIADKALKICE